MQSSKGDIHKQFEPSRYLRLVELQDRQLSILLTQVKQLGRQGLQILSFKKYPSMHSHISPTFLKNPASSQTVHVELDRQSRHPNIKS